MPGWILANLLIALVVHTQPISPATMLQRIGKYEILEQIGRGGQGTVYRARDTGLDRIVAIKVLDQSVADDPSYLNALRREAQLAANLDHPNIVTVHALEVENDITYIVMEYLSHCMDQQRPAQPRLMDLTERPCQASHDPIP